MRTRDLAIATTAATVLTALVVMPGMGGAAAVSPSSSSTSTVRIAFTGGAARWTPSANARVTTVRSASSGTVQIKPRWAAGRKTISMRSTVSADPVGASSVVTASARLRTSQPGRRLTLRVMEVNRGKIVTTRSATMHPSSRSWRRLTVRLRTTRRGSHIRLLAQARQVRGTHVVRLSGLDVKATAPATTSAPATAPATAPGSTAPCESIDYADPAQGVRTLTENFDGSAIDPATWRVRDNTFLNQDQAWITKDAVSVHDGYLDIAGGRLPADQYRLNANALYANNRVRDYSTGYVDTIDRFGQKYGRFEVRAWVPSEATMSRGIWPAFWLRADHRAGEIDPMESYGAPTIKGFDPSSSYEWNSWADTAQGSMTGIDKQQTHGRADVGTDKIWQGWHTFGVNWSPGCLRYLYDGRTVGIVDFDAPTTRSYFRGPSFDDTFHIRLNMQIGSNYWGWADPEHTRPDFHYKVDWVRVYQGNDLL